MFPWYECHVCYSCVCFGTNYFSSMCKYDSSFLNLFRKVSVWLLLSVVFFSSGFRLTFDHHLCFVAVLWLLVLYCHVSWWGRGKYADRTHICKLSCIRTELVVSIKKKQYGKCPKVSNTLIPIVCFFMQLFLEILSGRSSSVDPDQTRSSLIWVCTVCIYFLSETLCSKF